MAKAGRWVFCPAAAPKIGYRVTLADRFRRWVLGWTQERPDVYMVTGFFPPLRSKR